MPKWTIPHNRFLHAPRDSCSLGATVPEDSSPLTRTHLYEPPPREKSGPRTSLTVLTEPGYAGTAALAAHEAGSGSAV